MPRRGARANTEPFPSGGFPAFSSLNSRFSATATTAAELMPEWKIVWNQVGKAE